MPIIPLTTYLVLALIFPVMLFMSKKIRYSLFGVTFAECRFLLKDKEGYQKIAKKIVDVRDEKFSYKDGKYIINIKEAIRTKRGNYELTYKFGNPLPLPIGKGHISESSKILKTVVETNVIQKLFTHKADMMYLMVILVMGIALAVSGVALQYFIMNPIYPMVIPPNGTIPPIIPIQPQEPPVIITPP